jgi:sigma-B regulation protein RsbU (phosphoserine phosphatase)
MVNNQNDNGEKITAAGLDVLGQAPARAIADEVPGPVSHVELASDEAHVLIERLFGGTQQQIPGMRYAIAYRAANGKSGGDIADVFHYDNDHVSFLIADIAGKGSAAAAQAAMVKYGLRTLASAGLMPESVMRALNRLYFESITFENVPESFATVFFGIIDATRRFLFYSNAGHEPVLIIFPDGKHTMLDVTGPLIGVFGDQHHLFKQSTIELPLGTLLVAATDGVTETRGPGGEFYGVDRFVVCALNNRDASESDIAQTLLADVNTFSASTQRDDIAIIVSRFSHDAPPNAG